MIPSRAATNCTATSRVVLLAVPRRLQGGWPWVATLKLRYVRIHAASITADGSVSAPNPIATTLSPDHPSTPWPPRCHPGPIAPLDDRGNRPALAQKAPGSRRRNIRVNGRTPAALSNILADSAFGSNDVDDRSLLGINAVPFWPPSARPRTAARRGFALVSGGQHHRVSSSPEVVDDCRPFRKPLGTEVDPLALESIGAVVGPVID